MNEETINKVDTKDETYVFTKQQRIYSRMLHKKNRFLKKQAKVDFEVKTFFRAEFFKIHKSKQYEEVMKECQEMFIEAGKIALEQIEDTTFEPINNPKPQKKIPDYKGKIYKKRPELKKPDKVSVPLLIQEEPKPIMTEKDTNDLIGSIFNF
jgi:hypothetical protein